MKVHFVGRRRRGIGWVAVGGFEGEGGELNCVRCVGMIQGWELGRYPGL